MHEPSDEKKETPQSISWFEGESFGLHTEENKDEEKSNANVALIWRLSVPVTISSNDYRWLSQNVHCFPWEPIALNVAARSELDGHPTVLRLYPLRYDPKGRGSTTPVPWVNMYFLVCPRLITLVGRLEQAGYIDKFDLRIEHDPECADQFLRDHNSYAAERWGLLTLEDRNYAISKGYENVLQNSGVCGVFYKRRVKCLHAHYAHYLASNQTTLVGKWIHDALTPV